MQKNFLYVFLVISCNSLTAVWLCVYVVYVCVFICRLKIADYKKRLNRDNLFQLCRKQQRGHTAETMLSASLNLCKAKLNLSNILIPCKLEWNWMDSMKAMCVNMCVLDFLYSKAPKVLKGQKDENSQVPTFFATYFWAVLKVWA